MEIAFSLKQSALVRADRVHRVFFTSHAGTVAKYCNEHVRVCLFVCLSVREHVSRTTRAIFTIFAHVAYRRGSVLFRAE